MWTREGISIKKHSSESEICHRTVKCTICRRVCICVCVCALFSPEALPAGAVKELKSNTQLCLAAAAAAPCRKSPVCRRPAAIYRGPVSRSVSFPRGPCYVRRGEVQITGGGRAACTCRLLPLYTSVSRLDFCTPTGRDISHSRAFHVSQCWCAVLAL